MKDLLKILQEWTKGTLNVSMEYITEKIIIHYIGDAEVFIFANQHFGLTIGDMSLQGTCENVEMVDENTVILTISKKEKIYLKKY